MHQTDLFRGNPIGHQHVTKQRIRHRPGDSRLGEKPGAVPDILDLLADHETIIRLLREDAKKCSEEYEDEGTFVLLVGVMRLHEKMAWMLRSHSESGLVLSEDHKRIL